VTGWIAVALALTARAEPADDEEPEDFEEIVITEHRGPEERENAAEIVVDPAEAARTPGVQGDAIKAVQTLGGVARTAAGADGIAIWGASAADTRLYIDDIPVPRLFHLGGTRSVVPTAAVGSLSLIPGGAGARYGRGLGGVVAVQTADPPEKAAGAYGSVDPIDAGAAVHARPSPRDGYAMAARWSLLRQSLDLVAPDRSAELVPTPDYRDLLVRTRHDLPGGDQVSVIALAVDDRVERGVPSTTPDDQFTEQVRSSFYRFGLRLDRSESDADTVMSAWVGADRDQLFLDFSDVTASDDRGISSAGVFLYQDRRPNPRIRMRAGLDAQFRSTATYRDGALSLPAREGDVSAFGQSPGDRVNRDQWTVRQGEIGSFVSASLGVGDALQIEPGVRFEPTVIDGNRVLPVRPTEPEVGYTELAIAADPRLRISLTPDFRVRFYAAGGRYHQPPEAADLSPIFGSPVLSPSRAWHALGGVVTKPVKWLSAEAVAFGIQQRDLPVRPAAATPPIAGLLVSRGEGRSVGGQLSVRATGAVSAALSWTVMKAERRASPTADWRPFDGDQTHGLQATLGWIHHSGLELGGRFELATGFPRTPVNGAVFNTSSQDYDPIFGRHNGERLPTFASLSARAAWGHDATWGRYKGWLDVLNATNQGNPEEIFYSADYTRSGYVTGLPILPVLGFEVEV